MPWWFWVLFVPAGFLVAQWVFYTVRDIHQTLNSSWRQRSGPLINKRLLVLFGREVSKDGAIEDRFLKLLNEAAERVSGGQFDAVVVLGGDHHGNGRSYALTAMAYLYSRCGLTAEQIMTPTHERIKDMWAFSCSQEMAVAAHLQRLGAKVTMMGESQRESRYLSLAIAQGVLVPRILVNSKESFISWLVGLAVTVVDPNESHILKFVMRRAKRAIVTARDAA